MAVYPQAETSFHSDDVQHCCGTDNDDLSVHPVYQYRRMLPECGYVTGKLSLHHRELGYREGLAKVKSCPYLDDFDYCILKIAHIDAESPTVLFYYFEGGKLCGIF